MVSTVERIVQLWNKNRKKLIKTGPEFPHHIYSTSVSSFSKFIDETLEKQYTKEKIQVMSKPEKWNKFIKCWPGREIKHYSSKIENGKIVRKQWYVKWPLLKNGRMAVNGILKPEVREALLIKTSKTAHLKCITPFPMGSAPQTFKDQDPRFWEWLSDPTTPQIIKDLLNFNSLERVSVNGSWESQWEDVQRWMDPIDNKIQYEDYIKAIKLRGHKIKLPLLDAPTRESILSIKTNPEASVGLISSKVFGRNHRIADKYLKPVVQKIWDKVSKEYSIDTSIWCLGGRERKQKLNTDANLRSRPVIMPDGVLKVFGLNYAQPIYEALAEVNWKDFSSEIRTGQSEFHGNCIVEAEAWEDFINVLEADIKNHDGGTTERTLVVTFGLIRSMFPDSEEIDKHFFYMMSGEVFKNFAIPGRFVYRVLKGLCTGSAFTSILVSLCNWLNWSAVITMNNIDDSRMKLALYGDDTKIGLPHDTEISQEKWKEMFEGLTGHKLDPCLIKWNQDPIIEDRPTFLKAVTYCNLPCRLPSDVLESISFTKRVNRNDHSMAENMTNQAFVKSFHWKSFYLLMNYRKWLFRRYWNGINKEKYLINVNRAMEDYDNGKKDEDTYNETTINYLYPIIREFEKVKPEPFRTLRKNNSLQGTIEIPDFMNNLVNEVFVNKSKRRGYHKYKSTKIVRAISEGKNCENDNGRGPITTWKSVFTERDFDFKDWLYFKEIEKFNSS